MIIQGHFAGARARHYTDRELEELRKRHDNACSFMTLGSWSKAMAQPRAQYWQKKLVEIGFKSARQNLLEAKLLILQDELQQLKALLKKRIPRTILSNRALVNLDSRECGTLDKN